jgi:hypothetical protein
MPKDLWCLLEALMTYCKEDIFRQEIGLFGTYLEYHSQLIFVIVIMHIVNFQI